ncbi:response regulator [Haloarchaeobius sp. HME9146]|uniref:response regulator n=1 Tax=Haloarchaeobius sp. HME9146 TaxID=2978732 RepID=UPI0021C187BD|nr:response regulator [Haloarchaeobius sp. HME9146]MCT9097632.1 response regulator [Haloarchaeobius sp. HME9146]
MTEQTDNTGDAAHIPSDDLFEALSDHYRRKVLFHLRQNGLATVDELTVVAAEQEDEAADVRETLVETHLPMLESLGLVDVEADEQKVELLADPDEIGDWLDLAVKRDVEAEMNEDAEQTEVAAHEPEDIRVLLVDDAPDFVSAVADLLEREHEDLDIMTATSAPDAFTVLKNEEVDCIVSDYKMPAIDGLEFLDAVRDEYPDVSFIMFTNKGSEHTAGEAVAIGVSDYLQKETSPEGYDRLVDSIRNAVGKQA